MLLENEVIYVNWYIIWFIDIGIYLENVFVTRFRQFLLYAYQINVQLHKNLYGYDSYDVNISC